MQMCAVAGVCAAATAALSHCRCCWCPSYCCCWYLCLLLLLPFPADAGTSASTTALALRRTSLPKPAPCSFFFVLTCHTLEHIRIIPPMRCHSLASRVKSAFCRYPRATRTLSEANRLIQLFVLLCSIFPERLSLTPKFWNLSCDHRLAYGDDLM